MKRIGDLMAELGFRKGSSLETQKAFVKNLVRNLPESRVQNLASEAEKKVPEQLSFDFSQMEEGLPTQREKAS